MRIAFVVSNLTYPPEEGLHQQTLLTAQIHLEHGNEVHLMGFCRDPRKLDLQRMKDETGLSFYMPPIPSRLPDVVLGFVNRFIPGVLRGQAVKRLKKEILSGYDVIHFENIAACGLVRKDMADRAVIGLIDPGTLRWKRMFKAHREYKLKLKAFLGILLHNLLESAVAFPGIRIHVVSQEDANYLKARRKKAHVRPIPVAVPIHFDPVSDATEKYFERKTGMIFMDLRQPHLRSSFLWFIQNVYRPVCSEECLCDLLVLGRTSGDPELEQVCLGLPIRFVPWVEDLDGTFAAVDFVIVPDQVGTGIKNRVVQAMAAGKPVVGTPIAFEGIPALNGIHALVVNGPDEMARVLIELCKQSDLRELLGKNARKLIVKQFGKESVQESWREFYSLRALVTPKTRKTTSTFMVC